MFAALAAVIVCIVLLLLQNSKLKHMDDLEKQFQQLQNQMQESQKGDAALLARQDLLIQSVESSLEKLQARQTDSAMQTEQKLDQMRRSLSESLERMQTGNQAQLDSIRKTVDEKLQETLDRKLNDSFQLVSQRLEQVYKGLGEMQTLAAGVGDLKKVLSNVKTRGVLGEIQLGEGAVKALKTRVKSFAKDVQTKYIDPPNTTDFAILFIPVEGLYAELVRAGMVEILQREYKVTLAGPTTMSALLNSLQMGFRTLAIQKRSSEV